MKTALVIFKKSLTESDKRMLHSVSLTSVVISPREIESEVRGLGLQWLSLENFIEPGSIYEASAFAEELSRLTFSGGQRISKSFLYEGYELWWMYYNKLYLYICLPYTQYKKLLLYLKDYEDVYFYKPPYKNLFSCYLEAYGLSVKFINEPGLKSSDFLSPGIFVQIGITLISLPFLILKQHRIMLFTSDLLEKTRDHDFRLKFVFEELRKRDAAFVEFVRSIEPWKIIIKNIFIRKRPIIYSEAVNFVGRLISIIVGDHFRFKKTINRCLLNENMNSDERFKFSVATQSLFTVYDDVWSIRIMKRILHMTGIKTAFIPAVIDRNFQTVIGCKLNNIPIIGILHGVASRDYNVYDFTPAYDGEKSISVDKYGVWSEWWKEYYTQHSHTYRKEQLYISGPMRPLIKSGAVSTVKRDVYSDTVRVLFVSEQLAVPEEVLPYLNALLESDGVSLHIAFRPYADGFESWLKQYCPEILEKIGENNIFRNGIKEAIAECDVIVGSHSTAVLESLLESKPFVFFSSKKWGDYFDLKEYHQQFIFYTEDTETFVKSVKASRDIPARVIKDLQERFFGDPYQNGSRWAVDQLIYSLNRK
jgi:hypothetical protein